MLVTELLLNAHMHATPAQAQHYPYSNIHAIMTAVAITTETECSTVLSLSSYLITYLLKYAS